jgi:hypothetical protein
VYGKINVALSALLLLLALRNATFLQLTEGTLGFELASCFVMFALWPIRTWRFYNNHPDWMSSTITINSEYITSTGTGTDSSYSWNSVTKVAKHCGIIMLHLSTGWAICIPIRCFPSQALADQFYLAAGQFHKQARYSDK